MKIDLQLIHNILYKDGRLIWDEETKKGIADSYNFLARFSSDKVIYGINTGFGPMAQWRVEDSHLRELQYKCQYNCWRSMYYESWNNSGA